MSEQYDRVRSFMERYVIERAGSFRADHEDEDMWHAVLAARRAYKLIAQASTHVETLPAGNDATAASRSPPLPLALSPAAVAAIKNLPADARNAALQAEAHEPGFINRMLTQLTGANHGTQKTPTP